ncbi:MAG: methylenetetrahydrofolate reductase [Candidatus Cloacimonetes bacterium]|nr:methylenetetrahydrofolate reductase [Candidatus Cloacimonadota bacterium]
MKLIDLIKQEKKFFSIEITPPFKNKSINSLFTTIERILPYQPAFVNITYHPLKITKFTHDDVDIIIKKHVNPLGLCAAIKYKYNVEVVPHFVCAGMNKIMVEDTLIDFSFLEIDNVLALRGDPATANEEFQPVDGGYRYASELVSQIDSMKRPKFINTEDRYQAIDFCIGVAGYPEKHKEASSLEKDIKNLKRKIDAGADYIITQLCYEPDTILDWLDKIGQVGINVPVIPGLKPLTSSSLLLSLKNNYSINIPIALENKIMQAKDKSIAYDIGIEHACDFSLKMLGSGCHGIHYFTMGNGKDIVDVVKRVF